MAPAACTIDYNVLKTILTTTVPSIADEAYAVNDYESIVGTYEAFFLGVAQLSDRLNPAPLKAAARHVFNCDAIEANKFSTQLVGAFQFCRTKLKGYQGSGGSHGSAWHKSVKAVVDKMHKPLQSKKTSEDLLPSTSPLKPESETQLVAAKIPEDATLVPVVRHKVLFSNIHIIRYA